MAKSNINDKELLRACEAAIEGSKQKVVMSIRVAKSKGAWGKGKIGSKGQIGAKSRVLAVTCKISSPLSFDDLSVFSGILL
ncbi:hypothetical protein Hanom_Chr09g00846001 [Helianthus anomalus]